mmetsp:Transcript_86597/g.151150  ORF Transcript_86597/g.151150 Transcript_86597/m.151150 type:complete len:205 (+) Transcript_86597:2-616(+)
MVMVMVMWAHQPSLRGVMSAHTHHGARHHVRLSAHMSSPGSGIRPTKTEAESGGTTSSPASESKCALRVSLSSDLACSGCSCRWPDASGAGTRAVSLRREITTTTRSKLSHRGGANLKRAGGPFRICMTSIPGICDSPQPGNSTLSRMSLASVRPRSGVEARTRRNSKSLPVEAARILGPGVIPSLLTKPDCSSSSPARKCGTP